MQQTTIAFPEDLLQQAERRAAAEGLSLPEVVRRLLTQWVRGGESSRAQPEVADGLIEKALSSFGMWGDRNLDEFLRRSRMGLTDRDQELDDARLDSR